MRRKHLRVGGPPAVPTKRYRLIPRNMVMGGGVASQSRHSRTRVGEQLSSWVPDGGANAGPSTEASRPMAPTGGPGRAPPGHSLRRPMSARRHAPTPQCA